MPNMQWANQQRIVQQQPQQFQQQNQQPAPPYQVRTSASLTGQD